MIKKHKNFIFSLTNGEKKFYSESNSLFDPGYDITFKELFLNSPKRLEDFLNNIYLENNNMKISDLEFIIGDYYEMGKPHGFDSLSSDITCSQNKKRLNYFI